VKALVVALVLGAMLVFAAAAQATVVKISLKGVTGHGVSQATVLIITEAQNRHIGGNWTVTQVKAARAYVKTSPIGRRYRYVAVELKKYAAHPTAGKHDGRLAFIGASPAAVLILAEAQNGHVDGNWTVAQVRAALRLEKTNPFRELYPDVPGLLQKYIASPTPGTHSGSLAYTGVSPLVFALGLLFAGTGLLLRRRFAA
jgi:hypothetical protein